ncbi:MAG: hypothetical protein ABI690_24940 [Chloroflexota bacterium]
MSHEIYWLRPERVLYIKYQGYQTPETLQVTLDDIAEALDTVNHPVVTLINWLQVEGCERGAVLKMRGHRAYSHPMAARGILVGFDPQLSFENEVSVVSTRGDKNTMYFNNMDDAMAYLEPMLEME